MYSTSTVPFPVAKRIHAAHAYIDNVPIRTLMGEPADGGHPHATRAVTWPLPPHLSLHLPLSLLLSLSLSLPLSLHLSLSLPLSLHLPLSLPHVSAFAGTYGSIGKPRRHVETGRRDLTTRKPRGPAEAGRDNSNSCN